MPSKIYTKKGDRGCTFIGDGTKVSKAALQPEVCGRIDELNVALGAVKIMLPENSAKKKSVEAVQTNLFQIAGTAARALPSNNPSLIEKLMSETSFFESDIDQIEERIGSLDHFIYPGDNELSIRWHLARVACRRIERALVQLMQEQEIEPAITAYLNRLSDWLFTQAREAGMKQINEGVETRFIASQNGDGFIQCIKKKLKTLAN